MPPRKKPKLSAQADNAQSPATTPAEGPSRVTPSYDLVTDPWTDEQETALLKGVIKWKPVGMHKHFRMVAISEFMKSQGYAPSHAEHTRIPGIWKKLGTLYNLPALDEREDSLITDISEEADGKDVYCPFELPEDEYGDMMFERRLAGEGSPSPGPSGAAESRRGSTVADTDEPRSSPVPPRGRKPGRGRPAGRGTRSSRLYVEVETRRQSPEEEEEEAESEEENEESEEEESEGAKEESEEDEGDGDTGSSPTGRSTRARTTKPRRGGRRGGGVSRRGRRRQN